MRDRARGDQYRTTIVCVDAFGDGLLRGRLYHPYLAEGRRFENAMQFLRGMESLLDSMQLPQAFTCKRTFASPLDRRLAPAGREKLTGDTATFAVRVLFRQNASWQGSVVWMETGREERFRSALELLFLMESAVDTADKQRRAM